jgi:cytochrome c-type biogenesis protein CcmE
MSTTVKWGAVMLVVAGCVGYLIYSAAGGASEYYLTVGELQAHPVYDQDVRVAGVVQNDVIHPSGPPSAGPRTQFTEKDSTASILVVYQGPLPDIFQPGITVVSEGRLGADGVFHARNVLAKCPSRFATTPYTS